MYIVQVQIKAKLDNNVVKLIKFQFYLNKYDDYYYFLCRLSSLVSLFILLDFELEE